MTNQGYKVLHNSPPYGNCQFSSIGFALSNLCFFRSADTFRNDVISYLKTHLSAHGYRMALFSGVSWSQYVMKIRHDGTYSDKITPHIVVNTSHIKIVVVSTIGGEGSERI